MNESRIIYEFPMITRVRSFLRFEYLLERIETSMNGQNDPVGTLHTLHQLLDLIRYNDVKSELLLHLRWQEQELQKLSDNPPIDPDKLSQAVEENQKTIKNLGDFELSLSTYTSNHFLNSTKLRVNVPGGTCSFDLPQLHAWLHFDAADKLAELEAWFKPLRQLKTALASTLSLTRMSAEFSRETAESGYYHRDFPSHSRTYRLIRIATENIPNIYPEISCGSRHCTAYFFKIDTLKTRPCQTHEDVQFELARCTL